MARKPPLPNAEPRSLTEREVVNGIKNSALSAVLAVASLALASWVREANAAAVLEYKAVNTPKPVSLVYPASYAKYDDSPWYLGVPYRFIYQKAYFSVPNPVEFFKSLVPNAEPVSNVQFFLFAACFVLVWYFGLLPSPVQWYRTRRATAAAPPPDRLYTPFDTELPMDAAVRNAQNKANMAEYELAEFDKRSDEAEAKFLAAKKKRDACAAEKDLLDRRRDDLKKRMATHEHAVFGPQQPAVFGPQPKRYSAKVAEFEAVDAQYALALAAFTAAQAEYERAAVAHNTVLERKVVLVEKARRARAALQAARTAAGPIARAEANAELLLAAKQRQAADEGLFGASEAERAKARHAAARRAHNALHRAKPARRAGATKAVASQAANKANKAAAKEAENIAEEAAAAESEGADISPANGGLADEPDDDAGATPSASSSSSSPGRDPLAMPTFLRKQTVPLGKDKLENICDAIALGKMAHSPPSASQASPPRDPGEACFRRICALLALAMQNEGSAVYATFELLTKGEVFPESASESTVLETTRKIFNASLRDPERQVSAFGLLMTLFAKAENRTVVFYRHNVPGDLDADDSAYQQPRVYVCKPGKRPRRPVRQFPTGAESKQSLYVFFEGRRRCYAGVLRRYPKAVQFTRDTPE